MLAHAATGALTLHHDEVALGPGPPQVEGAAHGADRVVPACVCLWWWAVMGGGFIGGERPHKE